MAKSDFNFWSRHNGDTWRAAYVFVRDLGTHNGASSLGEGAAQGNLQLNSALTNPLSNSIGSTYCRSWDWEQSNPTRTEFSYAALGANVKTASGGALYPVTDTPSNGTLVAQSMRAFLRIDSRNKGANTQQGCCIGFSFKAKSTNGETNTSDSHFFTYNTGYDPNFGYHVSLNTLDLNGDTDDFHPTYYSNGTNAVPRLTISANNQSDSTDNSTYKLETASGTYAFDTWYHVRADLIPSVAKDTIKVYTAPISGAGSALVAGLGLETWTEVASLDIASSHGSYRVWGDSSHDECGYWVVLAGKGDLEDYGRHVPMIDKFQFLSKDIS